MMGRRQRLKTGSEYDVLFGKRFYCYLKKSGVSKAIKRAMNRRIRQEAKKSIREEE